MTDSRHQDAATELAGRDPVLAKLVRDGGPISIPATTMSHFESLVQAITYQQLAEPAARTIYGRLVTLLGGSVQPEAILARSQAELHAVGLSANKAASVLNLAAKVSDGTVELGAEHLAELSDQDIIDRLVTVRGIGPWTAEIFLMINLRRLDILPAADLGLRKGYALAWGTPLPTPREFEALAEPFRPYRSVFAWYCWRAAELYAGAPASAVTGTTHGDTAPIAAASTGDPGDA